MLKTKINTVVFDLGGVLIDWNPDYVFRHIYPDPVERKWFFDHICTSEWNLQQDAGRPLQEATEEKVAEFPKYEAQIRAFYGRWEEMLGNAIESTVDVLQQVRDADHLRVYALTNWSHETFPVALERFEFLQWFEGIVVSGDEKTVKPHREIYDILLDRYDISASEAVFIDDNAANVAGAQQAGLSALRYTDTETLITDLQGLGVI